MNATVQFPHFSESSDRQQALLAPFIKCTQDVFSMMLGWPVELVAMVSNDRQASRHDCSGILGLSGAVRGSIVVSADQEMAIAATEAFLGNRPLSMDADVVDTVGELTNMIGGSSKDRLGIPGIAIGFPMVVSGPNHSITFDPRAKVEMLRFSTPHGPFTVEVAIVDLDQLL